MFPFKVPSVTMPTAGGETTFKLANLPTIGPKRGRLVITRIWIELAVQVDTDGSTTIAAGGWANFVQRFFMRTPYGTIDLSGPQIRALAIKEMGRFAPADPTNLAISQSNATRTLKLCVDLAPRMAYRMKDFTVPCDVLKAEGDGAIVLKTNGASSIGTGGGTTVDSVTATLRFECREDFDVVSRCKRELKAVSRADTTDLSIAIGGWYVRQMLLHKYEDHATGGASLSSTTGITIPSWDYQDIPPSQLQDSLLAEGHHDAASTSDPFVQSTPRAIAIVTPHREQKLLELLTHSDDLAVKLTGNSIQNLPVILDLLAPMDEASEKIEAAWAARHGLVNRTVKTADKTKKSPAQWYDPRAAKLIPNKFS